MELFKNIVISGKYTNFNNNDNNLDLLLSCCYQFLIELKNIKDDRIKPAFQNDTVKSLLQLADNANSRLQQEAYQAYECLR